jgi:hypothetical protein
MLLRSRVDNQRPYISHRQAFCKGFQDGSEGTGPYPDIHHIDSDWVRGWASYQEGFRKGQAYLEDHGYESRYPQDGEFEQDYSDGRKRTNRDGDFLGAVVIGLGVAGALAWSLIAGSKK